MIFGLIVNGKFCTGWSIPRSKCRLKLNSLNVRQKTQTGSIPEEEDDDDECLAAVFLREFIFLPSFCAYGAEHCTLGKTEPGAINCPFISE